MSTPEAQMRAIRTAAAWSRMDHVACIRVQGPDAFEALDRVSPAELYLRDGQILTTLFLDDAARPVADVHVCRDDEAFLVLAEGLDADGLAEYLRRGAGPELDFTVQALTGAQRIVAVNGPYAWEVLGEVFGPDLYGLPYLAFLHLDEGLCFRTGKTGEFGYDLLLPAAAADELERRLGELAPRFDLVEAGLEALDQCALENWFFNIRRAGRAGVTPVELQLQWRVSYRKSHYPGAGALRDRRRTGPAHRLTALVSRDAVSVGDTVMLDGLPLGRIIDAGYSVVRGDHVALALLARPYAFPGIDRYRAVADGRSVPVRTVSPPVIDNRSLHVSPQLHSYRTRLDDDFPGLVPDHVLPG